MWYDINLTSQKLPAAKFPVMELWWAYMLAVQVTPSLSPQPLLLGPVLGWEASYSLDSTLKEPHCPDLG